MPRSRLNSLSAPRQSNDSAITPVQARNLVMGYYGDEEKGIPVKPMAGLSMDAFRAARQALVTSGLIALDDAGRYRISSSLELERIRALTPPLPSDPADLAEVPTPPQDAQA